MIKLIPIIVLVFTNRYDAGSAARPLYYSNRIESSCFPFGPYHVPMYLEILFGFLKF